MSCSWERSRVGRRPSAEFRRCQPPERCVTGHDAEQEARMDEMVAAGGPVVVGLDNGGNSNNATVLTAAGKFLVDRMVESPSLVRQGPQIAIEALVQAMDGVLALTGTPREAVAAVGLDTPGPASADGVISSKGATNFAQPAWWGFDVRGALQERIGLPVVYNND